MLIKNERISYRLAPSETIDEYIAPLDGDSGVITTRANNLLSMQEHMISETAGLVVRIHSSNRQCGETGGNGQHSIIFKWYIR